MSLTPLQVIYKKFAELTIEKLKSSIKTDSDEPSWAKSEPSGRQSGMIQYGTVFRGPRSDIDYLSENDIEEAFADLFKEHEGKLETAKELLREATDGFNLKSSDFSFEYGEKGHVEIYGVFQIDGGWLEGKNKVKYWVDLSNPYGTDNLVVYTPDIERYFETIEEAQKFLDHFEYKSSNPF